jgi:hypothetical protein
LADRHIQRNAARCPEPQRTEYLALNARAKALMTEAFALRKQAHQLLRTVVPPMTNKNNP